MLTNKGAQNEEVFPGKTKQGSFVMQSPLRCAGKNQNGSDLNARNVSCE